MCVLDSGINERAGGGSSLSVFKDLVGHDEGGNVPEMGGGVWGGSGARGGGGLANLLLYGSSLLFQDQHKPSPPVLSFLLSGLF